jgi:hypothetical protein
MKTLALAFTLILIAAVSVTAGEALATNAKAPSTLKVVMHDPGCHWFAVGGKFALKASVAGPVKVTNLDEATLKVTGNGVTKKIPVGETLLVTHGRYVITMVGQAPDDNHLKLTVK